MYKPWNEASSKFRGVSYNPHAGKYEARAQVSGVYYNFGLFDDDISAAIVYDAHMERLGVPGRSNRAFDTYANERPSISTESGTCSVCNDAKTLPVLDYSNGEWINSGTMPCPKCQANLT